MRTFYVYYLYLLDIRENYMHISECTVGDLLRLGTIHDILYTRRIYTHIAFE